MMELSSPPASSPPDLAQRCERAIDDLVDRLRQAACAGNHWEGWLSSSALSTATAISALALGAAHPSRIHNGLAWLAEHPNADGGFGDTPDSPSNLPTSLLCLSAMTLAGAAVNAGRVPAAMERVREYVRAQVGGDLCQIAAAVTRIYGADRTFAVPILMNCALAGLVAWEAIPPLPFELAALPHALYRALRLHVVSYALPALIAIGLILHRRSPSRNPVSRFFRDALAGRALRKLQSIQPPSGGFLEATPLTSFVAMSLIPVVGPGDAVAARCLGFLVESQREDGSWPIDTNLSAWVTTGAIGALHGAGRLDAVDGRAIGQWIADRQYHQRHPYTGAAPGGWSWTHLSGGVPDVDDTSGAMLALAVLPAPQGADLEAAARWLLALQNSDGGWPTFCRGWGKLPFDRSGPDLTAHAVRALRTVGGKAAQRAIQRGMSYLQREQRPDGSWLPLWFGNQHTAGQSNPVLGTARVLRAWEAVDDGHSVSADRGLRYLLGVQNPDGGFGGAVGAASSIEETAVALCALAGWMDRSDVAGAADGAARYLLDRIGAGGLDHPSPIGLYFASLWYSESLYPTIWSLEALGRYHRAATARRSAAEVAG